jgi:DNA polymerase IV
MPDQKTRRIAHIDMDAFFASCELSRYPELKGLPMVVGGRSSHAPRIREDGTREFSRLRDYAGRGVLTTATYEARALGLHSAMPTMHAAKLAPDAILLPVNFELYRHYSRLFKDAIRSISPLVENIGIDEVYADVSTLPGEATEIAQRLKSAVFAATGLTCSVGIAPNKLLAKLCSEMQKPDGITIITMADVPGRVWPMPAKKINGIGPKASAKLESLEIKNVGQIAAMSEAWLVEHFGKRYGRWLYRVSHGQDDRPVVTESAPVSMSRETTFERNLHPVRDKPILSQAFTELCERVASDLQHKGYCCRTIGIKLRFDDFKTVTRDMTLATPINDAKSLRNFSGKCLKRIALDKKIRLLGVKASGLVHADSLDHADSAQFSLDFTFDE